jgi:hypothetical protein
MREVSPRHFFSLGPAAPTGIYEIKKQQLIGPDGFLSKEDERRVVEQFRLLPTIINRLAERFRKTKGAHGVLLEYHQKIPLSAAFAGFAAIRLGVEGVNRWRKELMEMFNTTHFDSKQEIKFGRRAGKTYMACLIIACLLVSQVKCSGIFMCLDKGLATENSNTIEYFINEILGDPMQPVQGKIVDRSRSEGILRVRTQFGTNQVRCTTDPKRSNIRGKGNFKGFFFVDESDFYEQKAWNEVAAIWSMPVLVALYTSQGYQISPANKMIQNAIMPNGKRVWRQYRICPGRISLIVSDDYDKTTHDSTGRLLFGLGEDKKKKQAENANGGIGGTGGGGGNGADSTANTPVRSILRPWYDPVMQTLAGRMAELTLREEERRNRLNSFSSIGHSCYHTTLSTIPQHTESATLTIAKNNAELESLLTKEIREGASAWSAGECVWLLTLPMQQDPNDMMLLKATMGPEAFAREMLSANPDAATSMHPTFDADDIEKLFLIENRCSDFGRNIEPIRWVIGFDPGGRGASDSVIVSALIFPPDDSRANSTGIDMMQSISLRQRVVVRTNREGVGWVTLGWHLVSPGRVHPPTLQI